MKEEKVNGIQLYLKHFFSKQEPLYNCNTTVCLVEYARLHPPHQRPKCHYLKNYLLSENKQPECKLGSCSDLLVFGPQRGLLLKKGKPLIFYIRQIHITTSSKLPMIPCITFPRESSVRRNQWFQLFRYEVALKLSPF